MRLSTIKLAGFKSFVDPTVLRLPGDLVGIVGPNGCGKSNLIDAVRWVMGEGSARSLRGESMSDVIFNGSASRKPVGQAAIELVFDNSQGRLGGPWARYAEIAIRRVLSRDGQSSYFLNGARCRRRDIADLFLGTGLGSRSYAIIEQGMISRLIEARPEELRVFVEEAAGISKYRERRRETETRIQHARDNLDRLDDIRDELSRQLHHLQRQARAAEQYRELRATERRLKAEWLSLRWRQLRDESAARDRALHERETELAAVLAEQRRLEAELAADRARRQTAEAACDAARERYYQAGAELSRIEQKLQHQRDLRQRREQEQRQLEASLTEIERQWRADRSLRDELATALADAAPQREQASDAEKEADLALEAAEAALRDEQAAGEALGRLQAEAERQADVERTRVEHGEQQLAHAERRRQRWRAEAERLTGDATASELTALRAAEQEAGERAHHAGEELAALEAELAESAVARRQIDQRTQITRGRLHADRGRLTALRTLQEGALGRHDGPLRQWLQQRGLADAPRLAERLEVEPGWEGAAEAVLAGWLDAIWVADLTGSARAAVFQGGQLTLVEGSPESTPDAPESAALVSKVRGPRFAADLLAKVRIVASLEEALARRSELATGERLVTPEGALCGRDWLRLRGEGDDGVLAREREIRDLEAASAADAAVLAQDEAESEHLRERQRDLERRRREAQQVANEAHRAHMVAQGRANAAQTQIEQLQIRQAALTDEIAELDEQNRRERERMDQAQARRQEAQWALERLGGELADVAARRERLRAVLSENRRRARDARQEVARWSLAVETSQARLVAADQALERLEAQRAQLVARRKHLMAEAVADTDAAWAAAEQALAASLERRLALEAELDQARQALEAQDAALRDGEQARGRCQRRTEDLRQRLEAWRLAASEARMEQHHLAEQMRELGGEPETLAAALPATADEADWAAPLEQVARRIQRLGPINLAAIEEFAQLEERKRYLDAQNADLLQALTALETAMSQMDRETRSRFRDTFERVNTGLAALFPRLFGGGQAYLELTGDDALDAGVAIMAKPPGKRIGSIGLLSGGEKALTAIALVFAFFQLNPAPFCLLDEVDAPLDDANVGRFGALVREISERVQVIFITHNKATMEIAGQLAGVTMQEPGVSRLVAVDIEEAARLAAVA